MYNSIASVELVSHMKPQFAGIFLPAEEDRGSTVPGPVRHAVSAVLRALANRLEPAPAAR